MKIALIQLNAEDQEWEIDLIPKLINKLLDVDLIVFPEYFPFDNSTYLHDAISRIALASKGSGNTAIIAGGLVSVAGRDRNTAFLAQQGKIKGEYFKRRLWHEDEVVPGTHSVKFEWARSACIPLICADAANTDLRRINDLFKEAIALGAGAQCPIVVPSYGAWLNESYWQKPLQEWSTKCNAPVLICGVSGTGKYFTDYDGVSGNYGGGGSGVFWPDGEPPIQRKLRGAHIVDLNSRTIETRSI